jgi:hypothetical protein
MMLDYGIGFENDNLIERTILIKKIKPWDIILLKGQSSFEYFSSLTNVYSIVAWKSMSGTLKSVFDVRR